MHAHNSCIHVHTCTWARAEGTHAYIHTHAGEEIDERRAIEEEEVEVGRW